MAKEIKQKKPVGRPEILPHLRRHKQAASVTDAEMQIAKKNFGNLGNAIRYANYSFAIMTPDQTKAIFDSLNI